MDQGGKVAGENLRESYMQSTGRNGQGLGAMGQTLEPTPLEAATIVGWDVLSGHGCLGAASGKVDEGG